MKSYDWTSHVRPLYDKAFSRYQAGHRDPQTLFEPAEVEFLKGIGASAMELYDFAEDADSLEWETALLILSVRRDYFLVMQKGVPSARRLTMADFSAKTAELGGIPWLPRIIQKAEGRLRGELPLDLMYCCGGDRAFLRQFDLHPADFLREVWAAAGDEQKVLAYVKRGGKPVKHQ
ncbi:MAG: DUF5069 domain-containing protein [Chthoniobacteraceae bacterium]